MEPDRKSLQLREESAPAVCGFPARVFARQAGDAAITDALRSAIDAAALDPSVFQDSAPYFWSARISSDVLDAWYTRMAPSSLKNYAADAEAGVSFQDSHDTWRLPLGRSLTGNFIAKGEGGEVFADFFTIRGLKFNDGTYPMSDDYINAMRAGIVKDVSIGFIPGEYICSVCQCDMLDWDSDCRHWPGDEVEIKDKDGKVIRTEIVFAWVANARLAEVSAVYNGATPGAMILKAQAAARSGQLRPEQVRLLEQRYRINLPDARRSVAVGKVQEEEMAERTNPSGPMATDPKPAEGTDDRATVAETTLTDIRTLLRTVYPESLESEAVTAASADGAIAVKNGTVYITKGTAAALTLADPVAGDDDGCELHIVSTTAAAHTVSNAAGSGFNAGGSAKDVATFGAAIGNCFNVEAYQGKWYVVGTPVGVTLG
jgi:phage head maturation protease